MLIRGEGDSTPGDFLNVLNPRADIGFHGRRGQFDVNYDGAILLYHDLSTLNSYDQRAAASARRRISPQVTLFVRNSFALVPTTQTVELVGVPFLRTGSTVDDLQSGVEAVLGKHTTMAATYAFQWVRFDSDPIFAAQLHGGYSNGGSLSLRRSLSSRSAVVVDASFQHALVTETNETFVVQNVIGGIHHQSVRACSGFWHGGRLPPERQRIRSLEQHRPKLLGRRDPAVPGGQWRSHLQPVVHPDVRVWRHHAEPGTDGAPQSSTFAQAVLSTPPFPGAATSR